MNETRDSNHPGSPTRDDWNEIREGYQPDYESQAMDLHTDELDTRGLFNDRQVNRWTDIVFSPREGNSPNNGYSALARVSRIDQANESFFLGPNTPEWNETFRQWWDGPTEPGLLLERQRLRGVGEYDEAG